MSQQQKQLKIILIGDSCYDKTHFGHVNRLSPEAPIPIVDYNYTTIDDGMTSNVYKNFINLGLNSKNIFLYTHFYEEKERFIDIKTSQQLLRVDREISSEPVSNKIPENLNEYDAIVISDYNKGLVNYDMIENLRNKFNGPIFVDSKKPDLAKFKNCILKINNTEWENRISNPIESDVIVTHGGDKVCWMHNSKMQIFNPPKVETYDACGCGDTFLASLVFWYLKTNGDMATAINYAMDAAAITIQHIGVYAPEYKEIINEKNN